METYYGDLLWRPLEGCWGRNQDFIGFLVPITSLTQVGSILCLVYHLLPLATIALVHDNREFEA